MYAALLLRIEAEHSSKNCLCYYILEILIHIRSYIKMGKIIEECQCLKLIIPSDI